MNYQLKLEKNMLFKTVVHELIQENRPLYRDLRRTRRLMRVINRLSEELRQRHQAWIYDLKELNPEIPANHISSAAFELALQEIQGHLHSASSENDLELDHLESAIQFLRNHS